MTNLIGVFKTFPKELFRVNNGHYIELRQWLPKRHAFDICINKGMVQAKALQPHLYQAPNGASMRPNSPYQQHLVARLFKGKNVIIYAVPPGTRLPDDLLLVHERSDHFSLQPARDMTIEDLNDKITSFLLRHGTLYTKQQWLDIYTGATDFEHIQKSGDSES